MKQWKTISSEDFEHWNKLIREIVLGVKAIEDVEQRMIPVFSFWVIDGVYKFYKKLNNKVSSVLRFSREWKNTLNYNIRIKLSKLHLQ